MVAKVNNFHSETHEQLVGRVKKELTVTMIMATLSMVIGYFVAKLI
ncbi:MAG: hypothetical protein ACYDG6_04810 [Thermincolia bacterium]